MPSLRSSRPTGHDPYRNVRQSDSQIQHSQLDNWAADLRHRALPRSGLVQRDLWNVAPGPPRSIRFYAHELYHLAPFLGFLGDELIKIRNPARKRRADD